MPLDHLLRGPGGNVTFSCLPATNGDEIENVDWIINGSPLGDLNQQNVQARFSSIGNGLGILRILNVSNEYNMTTIQCRASVGDQIKTSNTASIRILPGFFTLARP